MQRKWRPTMSLVVGVVSVVLISVPVLALLAMRLSSNQFVRETEQSLINQAAIFAEIYADLYAETGGPLPDRLMSANQVAHWNADLHPWDPVLNLRNSEVLPPLPEFPEGRKARPSSPSTFTPAAPPAAPSVEALSENMADAVQAERGASTAALPARTQPEADPYQQVAPHLLELARSARGTTLSGAIFLDAEGVDLRPSRPQNLSFAPEVQAALAGRVGTALRDRGDSYSRHPLTSISRDTWYRVFVAFPVVLEDRVIGVVYLSRTPSNFAKFVVNERAGIAGMLAVSLITGAVIGFMLLRLFSKPVRALSAQARDIAHGRLSEPVPLRSYGIRELAELGQSMIQMARALTDRSRQVSTYTDHVTHELKSPVTSILGAAELLDSENITEDSARTLRHTIETQALRMNTLLDRLRDMSRLRDAPTRGSGPLADMLPDQEGLEIIIQADSDAVLPMLPEHGAIVFQQLARNAVENGASQLQIAFRDNILAVADNGRGAAAEDIGQLADPFFTTRREEGGTGMGLAIVTAILQNYQAEMRFVPLEQGLQVEIAFSDSL